MADGKLSGGPTMASCRSAACRASVPLASLGVALWLVLSAAVLLAGMAQP
ncbi:MAG: hypothetical protein LCH61_02510 [Proteobacteria bacterium]|nr:hypothetical protein [Pseudomonadota bacterium]